MDDSFINGLRRQPPQGFAERLHASLSEAEAEVSERRLAPRAMKWTALAASIALAVSVAAFPPMRAGAEAFLDFFRVVNVVGVSFDASRLKQLHDSGLDLPQLLGGQVEVLEQPGAPMSFATPEAAGQAAGTRVLAPAWVPVGWERAEIEVVGKRAFRVTADTQRIQALLDALAISDVAPPAGLDGQTATVSVPPIVSMSYRNGTRAVNFLQAQSPEISFPEGTDLSALAEMGLRILGLDSADAYRFAQNIDWRSTLLVPIPAAAATFREVNVLGGTGLMIESASDTPSERQNMLLWSVGGKVFAMSGALLPQELLEMAQTVQ
ncbi:MAG TPA: hypothetical protein VFY39_06920 [Gammaproteobacteria bacterium]|nr:hypothetical protein [Gammaproteobacteria bacterium]